MSQLRCKACDFIWSSKSCRTGDRCGVRLSSAEWCDGTVTEHGCGGPWEACDLRGCEECGGQRRTTAAEERARIVAHLRRGRGYLQNPADYDARCDAADEIEREEHHEEA